MAGLILRSRRNSHLLPGLSQRHRRWAGLRTTNRPDAVLPDIQRRKKIANGSSDERTRRIEFKKRKQKSKAVFNSSPRRDYQSHRAGSQDQAGSSSSMSTLIGAGIIAAAILLSTLITAVGNRYVGFESPAEDTAWLVDRLTGRVYKCRASDPGRASCKAETATGSIPEKAKP
jgi:hypothetical protein